MSVVAYAEDVDDPLLGHAAKEHSTLFPATAIVDAKRRILGIYTDGDLRRTLDTGADIRTTIMRDVMHTHCKTVSADTLAAEALHMLEENKITGLLVADDDTTIIGAFNIHDLFREGLM